MEQQKKIIFLGILGIVLAGVLIYTFSQNEIKNKKDKQEEKIGSPEITVKNFYDWYKKQDGSVIENTKIIVEKAKENGFITPEFATTTIQHPLTTSKKADTFICASKKSEKAFPTIFTTPSISSSTDTATVKTWSSFPNHIMTITFDTKQKRISRIQCSIIPDVE